MSRFLLHPAWQISESDVMAGQQEGLHDLRKLCKQVRYQGEFFYASLSQGI
ncbi:MAG: CHAD domain-containing protein [Acaryochloridaceae cyanobacterium RL_2_7]|nr:CHAD domain-containing protein [Acaryochloridaceae cyanobacterium RL_2_7]